KSGESRSIKIRLGRQVHSGALASHLLRSVGYHAIPSAHRSRIKLYLGDHTLESFLSELTLRHGVSDVVPHAHIAEYNETENYVILKNVLLEAYPEKKHYVRGGAFRTGRNGYRNRREYRAFLLMAALISLNDTADRQTSFDLFREEKGEPWKPLLFHSDVGYSMGSYLIFDNMGAVNDYTDNMSRDKGDHVSIKWAYGSYKHDAFRNVTYADARWIIRRLLRLDSEKIYDMAIASGFPVPVALMYQRKISSRIRNFGMDFGLTELAQGIVVKTKAELHQLYPEYITPKGKITYKLGRDIGDNSIYGPFPTFTDIWGIGVDLISRQLDKKYDVKFNETDLPVKINLANQEVKYNIKLGANRTIKINKEGTRDKNRYLVTDEYQISIPVGAIDLDLFGQAFSVHTPLSAYRNYQIIFYSAHPTYWAALSSRYFRRLNPFQLNSLKENLKDGEGIHIIESHGGALGALSVRATNYFSANFSPLKVSGDVKKEMFITKDNGVLEIVVKDESLYSTSSSINLQAILSLGAGIDRSNLTSKYRLYRAKETEANSEYVNAAFSDAIFRDNFWGLDEYFEQKSVELAAKSVEKTFNFFFWKYSSQSGNEDLVVGVPQSIRAEDFEQETGSTDYTNVVPTGEQTHYQVFRSKYSASVNRAFDGVWNRQVNGGSYEGVINWLMQGFDQSKSRSLVVEAIATDDLSDFSDIRIRIVLSKFDRKIGRRDFERNYVDYFSRHSYYQDPKLRGDPYFSYQLPAEFEAIYGIQGVMAWQVGPRGVAELLEGLEKSHDPVASQEGGIQNTQICDDRCYRDIRSYKRTVATPSLSRSDRKELLKNKLEILRKLLTHVFAYRFGRVGLIRELVSEKNYWLVTEIEDLWEKTHQKR
ncbi:MAG: hypothetical protein KDD43_04320, partial [Bdellovibrionales bacterium]|nr:hypothetical protein [Bdellovibrionales bacterium]